MIDLDLTLDSRHLAKHLPNTPQTQKPLEREGSVHLFRDRATLETIAEAILQNSEFTGTIRGHGSRLGIRRKHSACTEEAIKT